MSQAPLNPTDHQALDHASCPKCGNVSCPGADLSATCEIDAVLDDAMADEWLGSLAVIATKCEGYASTVRAHDPKCANSMTVVAHRLRGVLADHNWIDPWDTRVTA